MQEANSAALLLVCSAPQLFTPTRNYFNNSQGLFCTETLKLWPIPDPFSQNAVQRVQSLVHFVGNTIIYQ